MYCPSEFCLRGKPPREDGMVGGKSLFFECHNPTTGIVEGAVFLYPTHAKHMFIHMSLHMSKHTSIHSFGVELGEVVQWKLVDSRELAALPCFTSSTSASPTAMPDELGTDLRRPVRTRAFPTQMWRVPQTHVRTRVQPHARATYVPAHVRAHACKCRDQDVGRQEGQGRQAEARRRRPPHREMRVTRAIYIS